MRAHATRAGIKGAEAYGFKLPAHHLPFLRHSNGPRVFLDRLIDGGYMPIVLTPRSLLRQAVSWERAPLVGRHHYKLGESPDSRAVAFDAAQLISRMYTLEQESEFVRTFADGIPHVGLVYEDDLLDARCQQAAIDRICAAMGVTSAPVRTTLRRGSSGDLRAQIANWDEIAQAIAQTRFAPHLQD